MPSRNARTNAKNVWKYAWKVVVGISSVLALIFGSLTDATTFFLNLFTKQLPTVDDVTKIQITLMIIGGAVLGLLILHILRSYKSQNKEQPINPESLVLKTSEREIKEERPEHRVGTLSIPLGGFELTTDKLAYKVGDTIRASVRVLSLTLGTTTVRLIAPSERQLAIKTTGFHLSGTFDFDLGIVEQSWEKGSWRVIAQQGEMSREQKIEIL